MNGNSLARRSDRCAHKAREDRSTEFRQFRTDHFDHAPRVDIHRCHPSRSFGRHQTAATLKALEVDGANTDGRRLTGTTKCNHAADSASYVTGNVKVQRDGHTSDNERGICEAVL